MKKIIVLIALGGVILFTSYLPKKLVIGDILNILGINDQELIITSLFCVNDPICIIGPPKLMKITDLRLLTLNDKVKIANEAFTYAKSYCNSKEFKIRYEEKRMALRPKTQQLSDSEKETQRGLIAQQEEMFTPEILDMLPADARKNAIQELENMKAIVEGRLTEEQKRKWEDEAPVDPNTAIKKTLKNFLEATNNVDFDATTKLNPKNNHYVFVNPTYEKKDLQWKACYRAGKELTDATRSFAIAWLSELK